MMQLDPRHQPPTAQTEAPNTEPATGPGRDWLARARSAYRSSTSYVDSNYRKQWEDSIRAFNSQHPTDSKYAAASYDKRSRLFRPKTRSVIRKNEAAAAAAFFSNLDVVDVQATDQASNVQRASAEVMKALVQYRLTKSLPWFQLVLGGIQDAQTTGTVCAHVYWDYREEQGEQYGMDGGMPTAKVHVDKPCIELVPIENMRIDPSASWIDPVGTSPYIIHLIPMYVMDIKARMRRGEWVELADGQISGAVTSVSDSTRVIRNKDREDPLASGDRQIQDYDIAWVQRHIHRVDEQDWEFYTLGELALLSEPVPLVQSVFHGERPYVMGCFILETHKVMPSGIPQISKGLQDEANEIANTRIDNVKFALHRRWFAKRGKEVDIAGLVRNVPGNVVMMDDPEKDVREITWPDVTASSYEEQTQLNLDMDELLGNFNPAALMMNSSSAQAPARNMAMVGQFTGTLVEYGIRTFVETFVQPVLRQLVKLEQKYETDQVLLALAAKKVQLFQRYGIDRVTDELLNQELTLNVTVGMGATDPQQKLSRFLTAMQAYSTLAKQPVPGMNLVEVGKEIFTHLGYQDGQRFFVVDNPQVAMLQQQLQQAMAAIQQLEGQLKDKADERMAGIIKTRETNQTKIIDRVIQEQNENRRTLADNMVKIKTAEDDRKAAQAQAKLKATQQAKSKSTSSKKR